MRELGDPDFKDRGMPYFDPELFQERAGILEFYAGHPREEAELIALNEQRK